MKKGYIILLFVRLFVSATHKIYFLIVSLHSERNFSYRTACTNTGIHIAVLILHIILYLYANECFAFREKRVCPARLARICFPTHVAASLRCMSGSAKKARRQKDDSQYHRRSKLYLHLNGSLHSENARRSKCRFTKKRRCIPRIRIGLKNVANL